MRWLKQRASSAALSRAELSTRLEVAGDEDDDSCSGRRAVDALHLVRDRLERQALELGDDRITALKSLTLERQQRLRLLNTTESKRER